MPVGWLAARCGIRGQDHGRGAWHCHVVLPSDGLANEAISDVPTLAHHTSELFRRGLATFTVGIGDYYDANLLQVMAREDRRFQALAWRGRLPRRCPRATVAAVYTTWSIHTRLPRWYWRSCVSSRASSSRTGP